VWAGVLGGLVIPWRLCSCGMRDIERDGVLVRAAPPASGGGRPAAERQRCRRCPGEHALMKRPGPPIPFHEAIPCGSPTWAWARWEGWPTTSFRAWPSPAVLSTSRLSCRHGHPGRNAAEITPDPDSSALELFAWGRPCSSGRLHHVQLPAPVPRGDPFPSVGDVLYLGVYPASSRDPGG